MRGKAKTSDFVFGGIFHRIGSVCTQLNIYATAQKAKRKRKKHTHNFELNTVNFSYELQRRGLLSEEVAVVDPRTILLLAHCFLLMKRENEKFRENTTN